MIHVDVDPVKHVAPELKTFKDSIRAARMTAVLVTGAAGYVGARSYGHWRATLGF